MTFTSRTVSRVVTVCVYALFALEAGPVAAAPSTGFGAALELDLVTGQQSLVVIGNAPSSGEISIAYDGDALDLQGLRAAPGYQVFGFVDLLLPGSSFPYAVQLYGPGGYLSGQADPRYYEAGTVRVFYSLVDGGGMGGIPRAGLLLDQNFGAAGGGGKDLFALDFGTTAYPDPFDPNILATTYTVFAGPNDYTVEHDAGGNEVTLRPPDIAGVTVGGVAPQLPEPSAAALVAVIAGAALTGERRRRRRCDDRTV